jgi:hypothetical protein
MAEWREKQLMKISEQIQERIRSIQSPPEKICAILEKFYCRVPETGFGSQIHHLMSCLFRGYYPKTLAVIDKIFAVYLGTPNKIWDIYISAISEACQPTHHFTFEIEDNSSIIERDGNLFSYAMLKCITDWIHF